MVTKAPPRKPLLIDPTPELQMHPITAEPAAPIGVEPDLVDRIFDYIVQQLPEIAGRHIEIKRQIRDEYAGTRITVRRRSVEDGARLDEDLARLFNGRNASTVARQLGIARATVYRKLKQPGKR